MRILHVHWRGDSFGGGETYLRRIVLSQKAAGHEVSAVFGSAHPVDERFSGVCRNIHLIRGSGGIRSGRRDAGPVNAVLERETPDLVHLHGTSGFLSPIIVAEIARRVPVVKTLHDTSILCPKSWDRFPKVCRGGNCVYPSGIGCVLRGCYSVPGDGLPRLALSLWEKSVSRRCARILVGSGYMREELSRNSFPGEKIGLLPLFPDIGTGPLAGTSGSRDGNSILFVGRLDAIKGIRQFLEALGFLRDSEWRADIVGDGPMMEEARAAAETFAIGDRVRFRGRVPHESLAEHYGRASFLCMPSMVPESFGLVGVEAMAFGTPVVAFDSGGVRQWLKNGENGYLVERGNTRELADRIGSLLKAPGAARAMGDRGRKAAETEFTEEAHVRGLLRVYEDVVAARASGSGEVPAAARGEISDRAAKR